MDRTRYPTLHRVRRRRQTRGASTFLSAVLMLGLALVAGAVFGAFTSTNANPSNSVSAAPDWTAPTASRSVVGKTQGGTAGFVKNGGTYFIYAQVADTGNPASGVNTVAAKSGATTVPLASGSFTFASLSYNWRSAQQTLPSTPEGTYPYQVDMTDNAGNSGSTTGFTITVDNTAPTATDVQATNGGSIAGRPEQNDTITFTYSEPIEPGTILSGWTGAQTNVVVRINNNVSSNDQVQIFNSANTSQLPLGSVALGRTDYVTSNLTFGASGTAAKMTMSGNSVTVVLGTQSAAGTTASGTGTMVWTPSATPTDRAANAASTANATESGTADKEF
jgi:hypothetical protein